MSHPPHVPLRGLLVSLLMAALACGGSTDNNNGGPGAEVTAAVGTFSRDEAAATLDAMTLRSLLTPLGAGDGEPCATPSSVTDSDGDGVPDDATYIFTAPPCRFTGFRGGTL